MDNWLTRIGIDVNNNEPMQVLKYLSTRANMAAQATARDKSRRRELITENETLIRDNLHCNNNACEDPLDILIAEEGIVIKLLSMSAVLRDTLTKYYVEGRSPEAIAKMDNENVEAVRKRITRARNLLKGDSI